MKNDVTVEDADFLEMQEEDEEEDEGGLDKGDEEDTWV